MLITYRILLTVPLKGTYPSESLRDAFPIKRPIAAKQHLSDYYSIPFSWICKDRFLMECLSKTTKLCISDTFIKKNIQTQTI